MDTEDPVHEWMIFPFYISKESKHFESEYFLWPFFFHARDRLTGFEQWDFPFPFFRSLKGENLYGLRFFPFYGYKVSEGNSKRIFFLYPLYQLEEDWIGDVQEKTHRILLLIRIRTGEDRQGVEKQTSLRIWPFFDYEKDATGPTTLSFFYLFPFKDEGFERNFFPLFRIFRWEKDSQGKRSMDLFWGFYRRIKGNDLDFWEIAHLIGVKRGQGWKTVSIFKGLFLFRSIGRNTDLRFFYLPFQIRWSRHNASSPPLANREHREFIPKIKEPPIPPSLSTEKSGDGGEKESAGGQQ
jgi:hypothetical protein